MSYEYRNNCVLLQEGCGGNDIYKRRMSTVSLPQRHQISASFCSRKLLLFTVKATKYPLTIRPEPPKRNGHDLHTSNSTPIIKSFKVAYPKYDWMLKSGPSAEVPRKFASCVLIGKLVGTSSNSSNHIPRSLEAKIRG